MIRGDEIGLLAMEHGVDEKQNKYSNVRGQKLIQHGFETQEKSKNALERIQRRVGDMNEIADEATLNLEKQNQQILRINQNIERMDSTMTRTKRYLVYFGRSFCKDKVVLFMLFLIFLTIVGIIVVAIMDGKNNDDNNKNSSEEKDTVENMIQGLLQGNQFLK